MGTSHIHTPTCISDQAASHLYFNSSTKPHNPVPATKHVLASGTVQSSLPVSPVPCSTGVITQPTGEHTPDSALANGVSLGSATGVLKREVRDIKGAAPVRATLIFYIFGDLSEKTH